MPKLVILKLNVSSGKPICSASIASALMLSPYPFCAIKDRMISIMPGDLSTARIKGTEDLSPDAPPMSSEENAPVPQQLSKTRLVFCRGGIRVRMYFATEYVEPPSRRSYVWA